MDNLKMPKHVAIIPDGNRRWAKKNNLTTLQGHQEGGKRFLEIAQASRQMGIHTLTGWAFSTENWERDDTEVGDLMIYFVELLKENEKLAHIDQVKINHLGRKDRLPTFLREEIIRVEDTTKNYQQHVLNICLDYGGQDEIIRAINKLLNSEDKNNLKTKEQFEKHLDTANQPNSFVDFMIRTSGEQRTSGLLPYQMVYAELYFESVAMPEFTVEKFQQAVQAYASRDRRFGGNSSKT